MNKNYICHDEKVILYKASYDDLAASKIAEGGLLLIESDADVDIVYLLNGKITPRPVCPAALTGTALTGLPNPCKIVVNNVGYDCASDHYDLTFDQPGTYKIRVMAWPYLDGEFTYEIPAS